MGSLPRVESRPRMVLPDTPPELVSPTATSFSSRSSPSADHLWASQTLASLPMSNYDKTAGRDDGYEHRESTPPTGSNSNPQRQQLPSLSSLFGPPSSMRPLHSSLPGRPAHHPRHSPLEHPHTTAAGSPGSASYFPSPAAQPRTPYEGSSASIARSVSGSRSPGFADSRVPSETEPRWPQHDVTREYLLGSQDTSSPRFSGPGDLAMEYGQGSMSSTLHGGKGAVAEGSTSKEGLGPKIWTGTHFLPRFIRSAEVPGEGLCYFYDDGTHCKTVIDGEVVNAHWGVTKAGKPRKRLAIACITCREKKIKCDPDYPRCIQCDKFGRVCKFKNAPRGGHNTSPSTPPAELHSGRTMSSPRGSRDSRSPAAQSVTVGGQNFDDSYHKRLKLGAKSYSPAGNASLAVAGVMDHSKSPRQAQQHAPGRDRIPEDVLHRAWRNDVYMSNPGSIAPVIAQFFAHVDSTMLLKFLPEELLKTHLGNTSQQKLPEDLMILYSILAIGVALSGGPKHTAYDYAQVAYYAQKNLGFNCLQLVQSRVLLAAYYTSVDHIHDATELLSSAAAVSTTLQLNMELDRSTEASMTVYPFGMTRDGYKESRRRTLWSLFMLERFNGVFPNRPAMINPEDLYIRLPTDNQSFEKQAERVEPVFDPYTLTASTGTSSRNILANLVEMTHFWADCQVALYRIASRPAAASAESTRIQSLAKRIRSWYSSLPEKLSFSMNNLEESVYTGSAGSFLSMHILYHHAMIKVNRHHSAAALLGSQLQNSYAHNCFGHATGILDLIHTFDSLRRGKSSLSMLPHVTVTAAVEAVDALTANGSMASISDQINSVREALMAVENLANMWEDVRNARMLIRKRMDELLYIREQGPRPTTPVKGYRVLDTGNGGRWQICEPIDRLLPKEMDIVYSIPL